MNPLLDNTFLRKLNTDRNRVIYAKIISLNQYEQPIEQLEGVVTAGSITIDGQSAVRRTCSLTMSAKNLNINNVYWGLTTKIKIEIGLENHVDKKYDNIIWFNQGLFILTDFKTTQTTNNYTINLTGKDKMCLLNGDVSGNLTAPYRFDSYVDAAGQKWECESDTENIFHLQEKDNPQLDLILNGFTERYGDEYNFIREIGKVISLKYSSRYKDVDQNICNSNCTINLLDGNDVISIKGQTFNDNNEISISIPPNGINDFIIEGCSVGDTFEWSIEQKIPIPLILQEMIHHLGQERYSNIIISDIDPYGLEMVDSGVDEDYFILKASTINNYQFVTAKYIQENYEGTDLEGIVGYEIILSEDNKLMVNDNEIIYGTYLEEDNINLINTTDLATRIRKKDDILGETYTVIKISNGTTAGYRMTPLVYPDELTGAIGDSLTSILDKIVNMLGEYEYFYNLNGQFVFQAKQKFINIPWNNKINLLEDNFISPSELSSNVVYTFDDAVLTTQYQNTPNLNNIKNDYIVWGERKNSSGGTIKFHGRYAIDTYPQEYTDFNGYTWWTDTEKNYSLKEASENLYYNKNNKIRQYATDEPVDWRQLIFIMQRDWYSHNHDDDFELMLARNNCWPELDIDLYPFGKTKYEQYYTDIEGFWYQLYDCYGIELNYLENKVSSTSSTVLNRIQALKDWFNQPNDFEYQANHWAKNVLENPENLIFWFDFFEADNLGIGKFATSVIGDRPKTINESNIKVIIYRDTPDIIYCSKNDYDFYKEKGVLKDGYLYIYPNEDNHIDESKFSNFLENLIRTIRGRSVHQEIENMLYQYSYYNDTVSINGVPIYYLQPNTIISIKDDLSKVIGYYLMDKINLSLTYNGTMSITAIKSVEQLY